MSRHSSRPTFPTPFLWAALGLTIVAAIYFAMPAILPTIYNAQEKVAAQTAATEPVKPVVAHIKTPSSVRGIYMTQCVVGTPSFRKELVAFIEPADLNALVIDIKDYSGTISFKTDDPLFTDVSVTNCGTSDMHGFIEALHDKGIYVIGRITVFQDPHYSNIHPEQAVQSASRGGPWKDNKGLSFVDVSSKPFWDYIVALAKISYTDFGFDELNFDYMRYPSDGPMADAVYQNPHKAEALEIFFHYLHDQLKPLGVVLSADLFGYVTVHTDDLGIGQVLETALPYFDYIDPMVYPSHYNSGFAGLKNVNSDPYKVVYVSLLKAVERSLATTTTVAALSETPVFRTEIIPATGTTPTTTREVATSSYTKTP